MELADTLPYAIVLAGYVIFGVTGFGSALVIVPLLSWLWPLAAVVPVVLLLDVLATGHIGLRHRAQVQWRELARLAPTVLLGAAAGVWLGRQSQASWPLGVLGLYIAAVGVRGLRRGRAPAEVAAGWAVPAGAVIGAIETLFGTSGPPLVIYLSRRIRDTHALRVTLASGILGVVLVSLALLAADGRMAALPSWPMLAGLAAMTLLGARLGDALARRFDAARARTAVHVLLVVSGAALLAHALGH
ncbi:MAG: sulfite exporter TauE/SafE family protein [Rubrivivax sp.]|nr:sulfite exporter TauE/SafE family protein [Rubrivivax sp.]